MIHEGECEDDEKEVIRETIYKSGKRETVKNCTKLRNQNFTSLILEE